MRIKSNIRKVSESLQSSKTNLYATFVFFQGWELGILLICSFALSLFRSKSLKLKSDHEQFAHVAHDKRAIRSKKFEQNNFFRIFFTVCPSPAPVTLRSVALFYRDTVSESPGCSKQKSNHEQFLPALFTKEQLWAIYSCCSWQQSDGSILLFFTS